MSSSENSEAAIAHMRHFYPVRAHYLSEYLVDQNKVAKALVGWREGQLIRFIGLLSLNADELERGYLEKKITKVAWAARNLLELSIWVDYCNISENNAKRFRDDSARDLLGFSKTIQKMFTDAYGAPNPTLSLKMQSVVEFAERAFGVESIEDDFKRVSDAAQEIGRATQFSALNKLFSKFAHPTALALNSVVPDAIEADAGMRDMFLADGADFAINTLTKIREYILRYLPIPSFVESGIRRRFSNKLDEQQ